MCTQWFTARASARIFCRVAWRRSMLADSLSNRGGFRLILRGTWTGLRSRATIERQ
jgi:hypothetical protein